MSNFTQKIHYSKQSSDEDTQSDSDSSESDVHPMSQESSNIVNSDKSAQITENDEKSSLIEKSETKIIENSSEVEHKEQLQINEDSHSFEFDSAIVKDTEINYHSAIESNTAENYGKKTYSMDDASQGKDLNSDDGTDILLNDTNPEFVPPKNEEGVGSGWTTYNA